jgi:hypothetical protein
MYKQKTNKKTEHEINYPSVNHKPIIFLFFFIILARLPILILWNPYVTGSDAAIYMETAKNLVKGNGYVSSICRFNMDKEKLLNYIEQNGNRYQGWNRAPIYTHFLAIIYMLCGDSGFIDGINIFNLLLLILALYFFYRYLLKAYPNKPYIHFTAIFFIGMSYTFLEYEFGAWLESWTLFIFMLCYLFHLYLLNENKPHWWHFVLYSFFLAVLITIKRSVYPMVGAFLLHFLLTKKFKQFFSISALTLFFTLGWFAVRELLMTTPTLYPIGHIFPFGSDWYKESLIPKFKIGQQSLNVFEWLLTNMSDVKNLGILFPFTIVYLATHKNDVTKQLIWLLLFTNAFIYMFHWEEVYPRYIFPLFIPLFQVSAEYLDKMLDWIDKNKKFLAYYFLIAFTVFFQIKYIAQFTNNLVISAKDRKQIFTACDKLLNDAKVPKEAMVLSNLVGYNVYTDRGYVLAPPNMKSDNKNEIFDTYKIDYVLYCDGFSRYLNWTEYTITTDIFGDLELVKLSELDDRVMLYKVR